MSGMYSQIKRPTSTLPSGSRPRLWVRISLWFGLSLFVTLTHVNSIASEVVYTGRHALKIPFDFQDSQIKQLRATEVQLLVSTDRGKSWKTAARAKPQDRQFRYNAANNGEYWFAVRMLNVQGEPVQPGAAQVGLKVTVDDIAPVLDLKVRELSPGRVELTWQADDESLKIDTLEIQYREGESGDWKPLDTQNQSIGRMDLPVNSAGTVFVAARVSDQARNETTAEGQTSVSAASSNERVTEPDFSKPVAGLLTDQLPVTEPGPHLPRIITNATANSWPVTQSISNSANPSIQLNPNYPNRLSPFPAGAKVVRTNAFNIGYSLDQIGPSGVGAVDLYITEDNGRNWFHYGSDPDRKSPFSVRVDKSGQYGFAIRARSGIGLSEDPPQPGSMSEILVVVDQVAPRPKLGAIQQGQGLAHDQILLTWVLIESDLADQPVMFSQSSSPSGPWEPISGWLENSGRYVWTVDRSIDRPVYIRIEARDIAGNVGKADSNEAIQIDLTRPTARIIDVESVVQ